MSKVRHSVHVAHRSQVQHAFLNIFRLFFVRLAGFLAASVSLFIVDRTGNDVKNRVDQLAKQLCLLIWCISESLFVFQLEQGLKFTVSY